MNKELILKNRIKNLRPYLCIFLFTVILLSPILVKQEFWGGLDSYFHMNSIYEDAMQIKTGHFSYFISLFGFERSGRIINSLYSPILNYVCGALLLLCRSWVNFEFILFLITAVIGGIGMYKCAIRLSLSKWFSTILALIFIISRPVLRMWISNSEFTGLGATILLPYVVLIGIDISKRYQIRILPLVIVMAICIQIHLITSLIAIMVLIPLTINGFRLSDHKSKMVKKGLLAIIITICLSGNIWGALYDVFFSNRLISTYPSYDLQSTVNSKAITFHNYKITDLWQVYTLLLVAIVILIIVRYKSVTALDWCLLFEDLFFLFISSEYFPWDQLSTMYPKLDVIVQFPSRFITVSFILTLLLFGRLITLPSIEFRWRYIINGLLCVMTLLIFGFGIKQVKKNLAMWNSPRVVYYWPRRTSYNGYNKVFNANRLRQTFRSHNLGASINALHKITPDYLPTTHQFKIKRYYRLPIYSAYLKAFRYQYKYCKYTKPNKLLMTWRSHNDKRMQVPMVKYGNTVVILNHKLIHPKKSLIGTMLVKPRRGLNHLMINYQPGRIFKILSGFSIFGWLIVLFSITYRIMNKGGYK